MAEPEGQDEPKAPCKVCGTPMPLGASLCPTCKFFQNPVRRQFQFFSSIASIVTFFVALASLLAWLFSTVPNLRRTFFPRHHLSVVSANSTESIVFYNDGDRDVFVSQVLLQMSGRSSWVAQPFIIQVGVPPGQFYPHKLTAAHGSQAGRIVRGVPDPEWQQLLSRAINQDPCLKLSFFAQNDPAYTSMASMAGPTLNTFPVHAYVEYLIPGSSTSERSAFPAIGIMKRDTSSTCQ